MLCAACIAKDEERSTHMDKFDWTAGKFWLDVLQMLATFGLWLWMRATMGQKTNAKELTALKSKVDTNEKRLVETETTIKHLPEARELARINSQLAQTTGQLEGLVSQMKAMQSKIDLLLENELRG